MIITLRRFTRADALAMRQLFYDTVHHVNIKDYAPELIDAWAPKEVDMNRWADMFEKSTTYVAEHDGKLVGFGDVTAEGTVDHLYIHHDYQGKGIASMILAKLEEEARAMGLTKLETHANITAKPFFERKGYVKVGTQTRERRGHIFTNVVMQKRL